MAARAALTSAMRAASARSFLFLQGPLSPLYARLADRLEGAGGRVCRVNLCVGDALHWRRPGAVAYRGPLAGWPSFIANLVRIRGITDVILHGDQRPYHKLAAAEARTAGARVIVTELGLLRPDWMTLEIDGTGAASHFPRDAAIIRSLAARCPEPELAPRYPAHFINVALPDVAYNLSSTLLWPLYPHFRRHTIYFPPLEYLAWLRRLSTASRRHRAVETVVRTLRERRIRPFILPLQLEGDFQVRARAPFPGQAAAIAHILASFARHAPSQAHLLVKTHPLDNGLEGWTRIVRRAATDAGITDRVHMLDGGNLAALWPDAAGVVTLNSSAGLEALRAGVPVKTLAPAIYDVAGMTHTGPLDGFWHAPDPPDADLVAAFVRAIAGTIQVRGTIYSREGLAAAAANMTEKILKSDFLGTSLPSPLRGGAGGGGIHEHVHLPPSP